MAEMFNCSRCGDPKPRDEFHEASARDRKRVVTSQCRECRSEGYFEKRYDTVCAQCLKHRPLDSNKICGRCNEETGLRECKECRELLPLYLNFYTGRKTCKDCGKKLRNARGG